MTARRFDHAQNRAEIALLYGEEHEQHQPDWTAIIETAARRSPDTRDLRDPVKIGKRVLARARRRKAA